MQKKNRLNNTVRLFEILTNLSSIPRIGPILWEGIPLNKTESLTDHKCKVDYIMMILGDLARKEGKTINMEYLLRRAIIHDWDEVILGDVPTDSRSYQSYFSQNIAAIYDKGRQKALQEIANFIKEEVGEDYNKINESKAHPIEDSIENIASKIATLLELLNLRKRGYRSKYIEHFWVVTLQQIKEEGKDFNFIKELVEALDTLFDRFTELNPFLAKGKYPTRKKLKQKEE